MLKITPNNDNVIVEMTNPETVSKGGIVMPNDVVEESTLATVIVGATHSYHRDGTERKRVYETGDVVRLPRGKCGTQMPESPKGKEWRCVPEDAIYYKVEEI